MADPNIDNLLEFIGYALDREQAKQLLAISSNNVETAAGKFFDSDIESLKLQLRDAKPTWDSSQFTSDRYGDNNMTSSLPTFEIDLVAGYDAYPHSAGNSRAPSRPPSRTSQRSALSTHLGDAPMQSIENMQESGVIVKSKPVFGPANRDHYETSQWAMVPTATEVISDPLPSQRRRIEGQPVILKPSPNFNYLPNLIPILHSIPQYRNALLSPSIAQKNYWMGDDWWKGSPSPPARLIDRAMSEAESHGLDIIYETQRLIAFLDNTDRIYGSVGSLLELDAWKNSRIEIDDPDDDLLKFLLLWSFAYQSQVANAELSGVLRSTVNAGGNLIESFVLDSTVTREDSRSDLSLYDVLDESLFSSTRGTAHIVDISNVLILRLTSSRTTSSDLGCRIPATLYADRYLERNKHIIDSMYTEMQGYNDQLKDVDIQIRRLKYHTPDKKGAKTIEALKLLQASSKAFEHNDADAKVLHQLQTLHQSIESKLFALDEQSQRIRKTIENINSRFKPYVDDGLGTMDSPATVEYPDGQHPLDAMHHPFKLYGVATRRDVVYLMHPDVESNDPGAKQWWRMQYDTESSSPIIRRDRITFQDVVERATTESASALLIYASPSALAAEPLPLSKPLEDFVKKDRLNFLEELEQSTADWGFQDESWEDGPVHWDSGEQNQDYRWGTNETDFHSRERHDSNLSSTTLTPNTEVDDGEGAREMTEFNGGMDAYMGISRSASSITIGREADGMDVDVKLEHKVERIEPDLEMADAQVAMKSQHIDMTEKKGG